MTGPPALMPKKRLNPDVWLTKQYGSEDLAGRFKEIE